MKKKKQRPLLETLKRIGGKINEDWPEGGVGYRDDYEEEGYVKPEPFTNGTDLADGWDTKELEAIGLMDLIKQVEAVAYELRNASRGSYAKFGDTPQQLADVLVELGQQFDATADDIIRKLRQ